MAISLAQCCDLGELAGERGQSSSGVEFSTHSKTWVTTLPLAFVEGSAGWTEMSTGSCERFWIASVSPGATTRARAVSV